MAKKSAETTYFTKHLFGAGIQCATKLYYKSRDFAESKTAIPFIRHAVFNKRLLKALARSVYPQGIFVKESSIQDAAEKTQKLLEQEDSVLFDAIFEHDQMMARLPIVAKKGDTLTVFHIQTKAFDSRRDRLITSSGNIYSKWRKYLLDFAYQLYMVQNNWPDFKIVPILVMPEKSGEAHTGNLPFKLKPLDKRKQPILVPAENQELLAKIEVSDLISVVWDETDFATEHLPRSSFQESLYYLRDLYLNKKKEAPVVGTKCKDCEFRIESERIQEGEESGFNNCWAPEMAQKTPSEQHVFDLIGPGVNQWVEEGVYSKQEIEQADIFDITTIVNSRGGISHKMRQALQIYKAQGQPVPTEIMRPELIDELDRWQYPLHFLDFEAGNYTVPIRAGRSPYQLIVFQYSCHTLHQNGEWEHHQWIDSNNGQYPNYELVRQLMQIPNITKGTIVQYSNFERTALKTIRRELMNEETEVEGSEQLLEWTTRIIRRNDSSHHHPPYVADLSRLVKNYYYNREMNNSLSIKGVLQSVMSHSNYLKELYSKPYSSDNFSNIKWWQDDGEGGARNPYTILTETGDSPIRRGTEAMVVYGKLRATEFRDEQVQAYQHALLKYCELDTLAMVMIYQHWKNKIAEEQ
ncbi:DUF2779 domain-containing protein [Fodinibius halophilus]|uniref:DUF2779 domain-containing protein n=1 Tax=Fodinibius halophilus TaxID=1736908 RepID=A0A6M1T0R3_9BACT|nr:DUF2779 domain-containing protein [Fodinibius halophilus]NGP86805.1 DUF2779 domain-containing protein [Fodinibius halophilus]